MQDPTSPARSLARQGSVLEINNHPLAFICPDTKHSRHGAHLGFPPSLSLSYTLTHSLPLSLSNTDQAMLYRCLCWVAFLRFEM